ncbi:MAG: hypothetical protein GX973_05240 [Firmicutes bacterium]|nr:hypothetical protein [Bacillota bacterium]
MITVGNKRFSVVEITMAFVGLGTIIIALLLRYPTYALGVALATPVAWALYRWQISAMANLRGPAQRKSTSILLARSMLRLIIQLILLGLSMLAGTAFLFGVLTGFLLQVIAYTGQAFYTTIKKGGKA